jgi:hypothetical protein
MTEEIITTELPATACLSCGYLLDSATSMPGNAITVPAPGAVSICLACADIAIYGIGPFGLTLRPPTAVERAEIMTDIRAQRAIATIRELQQERRGS